LDIANIWSIHSESSQDFKNIRMVFLAFLKQVELTKRPLNILLDKRN
jgi:hypothetical protein